MVETNVSHVPSIVETCFYSRLGCGSRSLHEGVRARDEVVNESFEVLVQGVAEPAKVGHARSPASLNASPLQQEGTPSF